MFSSLATKIVLKKVGLSSNALDFSSAQGSKSSEGDLHQDDSKGSSWLTYKSLPLTVHPWLSPPPMAVQLGRMPAIGDVAPLDRDRKLQFGGGRRVLVVFLRCVGCAFAQKTFLSLRTVANRYRSSITCVAVSHSSEAATKKWVDMMGGAWNVEILVDEDRALYAAWGLGVATVWHLFNPTTQMQGWREKGWLGNKVAAAVQRRGPGQPEAVPAPGDDEAASTVLGNKWQESGAFAVDGRGTVVWGGKTSRADEVMDLEEGAKLLAM